MSEYIKITSSGDSKKRKIIEDKLSTKNETLLVKRVKASENSVVFPVHSATNNDKIYEVKLSYIDGLKFSCNCGDQFGVSTRTNCKHVSCVVANVVKSFVQTHSPRKDSSQHDAAGPKDTPAVKNPKVGDIQPDDLSDMFGQMLQIYNK